MSATLTAAPRRERRATPGGRRAEDIISTRRSKRAKSTYSAEIGDRLVHARKERNLTQVEAAKLLGVSQRTMQSYETGEVIPYAKMDDLSSLYHKPSDWILYGEDGYPGSPNSALRDEVTSLRAELDKLEPLLRLLVERLEK